MSEFCRKHNADMYICQGCGADLCSVEKPPLWVPDLSNVTGRKISGNLCPDCAVKAIMGPKGKEEGLYPELNRSKRILDESMSRYCHFYKAKDGKWYMELANREYAEREDASTYGPFPSMESALEYLENFSNPGSYSEDDSGEAPVPTKSPNGLPVEAPISRRERLFGRPLRWR